MNAELQELLALALVGIVGLLSVRRFRRGRRAKAGRGGGCCGASATPAEYEIDITAIARRRHASKNAGPAAH